MGIIRLLDTATTNKIAAGEVVSDPASVVKELMENSLDAGGTRINVEINGGGTASIKVSDNGCGIAPDDMEKAFIRHATSKIKGFDDLDNVATMGFRGEALASIAAVSKVSLTSRAKGNYEGFRLTVEAGIPGKPQSVGCAEGTTVEVVDLFYNVPARRKFLKSPGRETAAANEVVTRLTLGSPHAAVKLKNSGRTIFETYGRGLISAISSVLGRDTAEHLIPVEKHFKEWSIYGFVSSPFYTRSSRRFQYFYVNSRWVANRNFRYVLDHAYRTLVPKGRYPIAVLFLETAGPFIDVNVDPTKNTIRIKDEKTVLDLIIDSVRNSLLDNRENKRIYTPAPAVLTKSSNKNNSFFQTSISTELLPETNTSRKQGYDAGKPVEDTTGSGGNLPVHTHEDSNKYTAGIEEDTGSPFKVLAQLAGMYILYEKDKDLYIVDQHAAHERIRYESIKKRKLIEARQLVIPQTITLSPSQAALLEQLEENMARAGFQFEHFGGNFIVLREIPVELSSSSTEAVFLELLELTDSNLGSVKNLEEVFLISLACKTAVKAGQILTVDEMESIVEELSLCQNPLTCPHGRPTTICLSEGMLLKEFKRV